MGPDEARAVAGAWISAWNGADPEQVLALLHEKAVIADPASEAGKVRPPLVPQHVRRLLAEGHVPVRSWVATAGVDSVAVACNMGDGSRRVDTLVLAEDGRIVRVMIHL